MENNVIVDDLRPIEIKEDVKNENKELMDEKIYDPNEEVKNIKDIEIKDITPIEHKEEGNIYFILNDKNEIIGVVDSKTEDENCVLSPLKEINYNMLGKIYENGEIKDKELTAEEKKEELYNKLQSLCDKKSKQAKAYLAGEDVSIEQIDRYETKYQLAVSYLNGDTEAGDKLKLEAELQDISMDDLAKAIKQKGDIWKAALADFNAKIEAFRVKVSDLIEAEEFDKIESVLKKAEALGADATDEDVKKLFE